MCSLPVCRILKPRAEESGEYLCVFVFSNSPIANATIEVRGTLCFVFVLFLLPESKVLSLPLLSRSVFVQESQLNRSFLIQSQAGVQSLVIISGEVLHAVLRERSCRQREYDHCTGGLYKGY